MRQDDRGERGGLYEASVACTAGSLCQAKLMGFPFSRRKEELPRIKPVCAETRMSVDLAFLKKGGSLDTLYSFNES